MQLLVAKMGRVDKMLITIFMAGLLPNIVMPFYLPGIAPRSFCSSSGATDPNPEGCQQSIDILVNRLDSFETVIPYDYHKFDFCEAPKVCSNCHPFFLNASIMFLVAVVFVELLIL